MAAMWQALPIVLSNPEGEFEVRTSTRLLFFFRYGVRALLHISMQPQKASAFLRII